MNIFTWIGWLIKILAVLAGLFLVLILIFWKKTRFPEMIEQYKERKALESQIKYEAKLEAIQQLKPALIEAYKQKEVARMTSSPTDRLKRFSENLGIKVNSDKINQEFGGQPKTNQIWQQPEQPQYPPQYQQYHQPQQRPRFRNQPRSPPPQRQQQRSPPPQRQYQAQPSNITGRILGGDGKSFEQKMKEREQKMKELLR